MIIKIDHIALPSMDLSYDITVLKGFGYNPQFIVKGKRNLRIKRGLMKRFCDKHDLALFTSKNNLNIELINHGHVNSAIPYIIPIFENVPKRYIKNGESEQARIMSTDAIIATPSSGNRGFGFNKMIVKTENIIKSAEFWQNFGFAKVDWNRLEFSSPLSKCYIYLEKSQHVESPQLDDKGFNCIAFVTSSVEKEKEMLEKKGIKTTDIERFELNQKILDIFFAKGPSGELAELIGIK